MTSHFLEEIKCSLLFVLIFKRGDHESVMTVILFQFVQYFLSVSWCKLFASGDAILNDEPRTSGVHNYLRDRWEADKDAWSHQRASLSKWHQKSERFYGILKESEGRKTHPHHAHTMESFRNQSSNNGGREHMLKDAKLVKTLKELPMSSTKQNYWRA